MQDVTRVLGIGFYIVGWLGTDPRCASDGPVPSLGAIRCFYRYDLLLLFSILGPYCVVVALLVFFVGRLRVLSYVW